MGWAPRNQGTTEHTEHTEHTEVGEGSAEPVKPNRLGLSLKNAFEPIDVRLDAEFGFDQTPAGLAHLLT